MSMIFSGIFSHSYCGDVWFPPSQKWPEPGGWFEVDWLWFPRRGQWKDGHWNRRKGSPWGEKTHFFQAACYHFRAHILSHTTVIECILVDMIGSKRGLRRWCAKSCDLVMKDVFTPYITSNMCFWCMSSDMVRQQGGLILLKTYWLAWCQKTGNIATWCNMCCTACINVLTHLTFDVASPMLYVQILSMYISYVIVYACFFWVLCMVHQCISLKASISLAPGTEVKEMLDLTATWSQQSWVGSKFSRNDLQWTCKFQSCFVGLILHILHDLSVSTSSQPTCNFSPATALWQAPPRLSVLFRPACNLPDAKAWMFLSQCGLRTNTTRWFRKSSKALKMNSLWIRQVQSICVVDVTDVTCWHVLVGKSQRKISKSGTVRGEFEVCASRMNRIVSRHGLSADTCLHQTIMFNVLKLLKSQGPIQNSSHSTQYVYCIHTCTTFSCCCFAAFQPGWFFRDHNPLVSLPRPRRIRPIWKPQPRLRTGERWTC